MKALPPTAVDLVRELDALYPPRCIGRDERPEDAHRYAGMREVVEYLLARAATTDKRAMKDALTRT